MCWYRIGSVPANIVLRFASRFEYTFATSYWSEQFTDHQYKYSCFYVLLIFDMNFFAVFDIAFVSGIPNIFMPIT